MDCAPTPSILAQSKERKGSNFAIWQPRTQGEVCSNGTRVFVQKGIYEQFVKVSVHTVYRSVSVRFITTTSLCWHQNEDCIKTSCTKQELAV